MNLNESLHDPLGGASMLEAMVDAMEISEARGRDESSGDVDDQGEDVDQAIDVDQGDVPAGGTHAMPVAVEQLRYTSLEGFVHEWLYPQLEHDHNSREFSWCSWWWRHPEAVGMLGALWHQWEASSEEEFVGMSTFYVHYYLPLIGHLSSSRGPFASCAKASDEAGEPKHREPSQHAGPPLIIEVDEGTVDDLAASRWLPNPSCEEAPTGSAGLHPG